jgi:CheY-like chemotaxis protein
MSLDSQNTAAVHRLTPEIGSFDWSPSDVAPPGLVVENLRRRGIDLLRIQIDASKPSSFFGKLFGSAKSSQTTITIVDEQMRFDISGAKSARPMAVVIPFNEIKNIQIGGSALGKRSALKILHRDTALEVGAGLPDSSLHWLRERLLLEKAGLVWKPLHNVGRRTTRRTCNPDDDVYANWPKGPNRLVSFFIQEAPEKARHLIESIKAQNWPKAEQHTNWLKAGSAAVGASYLSELCQRLEIDIQTGDHSRLDVLAPHFSREFNKVIEILSRVTAAQATESPVVPVEVPETQATGVEPILEGYRILLVEDSRVNQEMARDSLEPVGCHLTIVTNGQAAIEIYEKESFDAILMDCQMPGINGFDATKAIRAKEVLAMRPRTPIIALTANALRDDREVCIAAGMDDYVSKPYLPHEIIEALLKWLPERSSPDVKVETLKDASAKMREAVASEGCTELQPGVIEETTPPAAVNA